MTAARKTTWPRLAWKAGAAVSLVLLLATAWTVGPALYHRWRTYPRQAAAIAAWARQRQPLPPPEGWQERVGACHLHSLLSHDSAVRLEEILAAAKAARLDFLLMADHADKGRADYSRQWVGSREGVRFVRGFEMKHGFMPWGLPAGTILNTSEEPRALARRIAGRGGLLFFAHCEEDRLWDLPELTGMEIYNIHADFKGTPLYRVLPEILLNARQYPDLTLRLIFTRPEPLLRRWDAVSIRRPIAGIAGNDAHQNSGLQGLCTTSNTFRLATTGPRETLAEWPLNGLTRPLLQLCCGPLQTNTPLFRFEGDRYETMLRFVNTHLWVRNDSEEALLEALRQGRALVVFSHLADARGFRFGATWPAESGQKRFWMGDRARWAPGATIEAQSPLPCRFTLLRDGEVVGRREGVHWQVAADRPGRYRVEAELSLLGEWVPWVYANPLSLEADAPSARR